MKRTIFLLTTFLLLFLNVKTFSQTEATKIDSVCKLMIGTWYKVFEYRGLTGKRDSVYSDEINVIERVIGTDSIKWIISRKNSIINTSKYKISYSRSLIFNENRWMLTNEGFKNLIDVNTISLTCSMDAYDGGGVGYSRNSLIESIKIDSVCKLMSGNWYKVIEYSGINGNQDSVYSDEINIIERVAGTDSIIWRITKNNTIINTSKYKISYSRSLIFNENRWMLTTEESKNLIEVNLNSLTCSMDAYDGGGIGYSRNKSSITLVPELDNPKFLFYSNPVQTELYISGINEIKYVNVFDMKGRLILKEVNPINGTLDISKFKSGLYFVQVISRNFIFTGKILKK